MAQAKSTFPQISRLFSASFFTGVFFWAERITLWALLIALFYMNISWMLHKSNPTQSITLPSLTHPFSAEIHKQTAINLWDQGYHAIAKNELLLAQDLYNENSGNVLGASTDPSTLLSQWESQPQELTQAYEFWKSVIAQKPDYRDGYIMTAMNAYNLGKREEAKTLLQHAYAMDPNYPPTTNLLQRISQ